MSTLQQQNYAAQLFDMRRKAFKISKLVVRETAARNLAKAMMRSTAVTIGRALINRISTGMNKPNSQLEP